MSFKINLQKITTEKEFGWVFKVFHASAKTGCLAGGLELYIKQHQNYRSKKCIWSHKALYICVIGCGIVVKVPVAFYCCLDGPRKVHSQLASCSNTAPGFSSMNTLEM